MSRNHVSGIHLDSIYRGNQDSMPVDGHCVRRSGSSIDGNRDNRGVQNNMPVDGNRVSRSGSRFDGNRDWMSGSGLYRPVAGNREGRRGSTNNWPADVTSDSAMRSHYSTHQRHHGKSQDYHHGWPGDGRIMQDGRSNNRHHPSLIYHPPANHGDILVTCHGGVGA